MAEIPTLLLCHTVTVETFLGDTAVDDVYAAPELVRCRRDGELSLNDAGERVGNVRLFTRLGYTALFARESRVSWRTRDGRDITGYVRAVVEHDDGGLGAWQHLEVAVR